MLPSLQLQEIDHYVHLERKCFAILQQQLNINFLTGFDVLKFDRKYGRQDMVGFIMEHKTTAMLVWLCTKLEKTGSRP